MFLHGSGLVPRTSTQQERGRAAAQDSSGDLFAAGERPLLVPCLRSDATSLAPAAKERASTASIDTTTNQTQGEQQKHQRSEERSAPPATVSVEASTTPYTSRGAERQGGRVSSLVEASVRAGDWVLPNRGGGSCAVGGIREKGWLRVEAVSVG